MGYKRKFWIARQHARECTPLDDPVAEPILECSNVLVRELIKGKTVSHAINKSHEYAENCIMELVYSKEPYARPSLQAIISNDDALDFKGEGSARIG
ncbi:MAG: hypothetical protein U9M95_00385 [Candidatus Altiarchaeota archaeon]|nr:hypothetical protein [Candidatus Altiarchaeota archaeon]